MPSISHTAIFDIKIWIFKKRIKKFKKNGNYKLIVEKDFDTMWINIISFFYTVFMYICMAVFISLFLIPIVFFIVYSVETPNKTTNIATLIVGLLGVFGVIYSANKKRRDERKLRFDASLYIIIRYLIEIRKGNYSFKILKDDLSSIFMNVSNNVLYILGNIQENICIVSRSKNNKKKTYIEIINKEVLFLIMYIREYYKITDASLERDAEYENIINCLIDNSGIDYGKKNITLVSTKKKKLPKNKQRN